MYIRRERFREEKGKKRKRERETEIATLGSSNVSQVPSQVLLVVGAHRLGSLPPVIGFGT